MRFQVFIQEWEYRPSPNNDGIGAWDIGFDREEWELTKELMIEGWAIR